MLLANHWFVALAVSSIRHGIGTTRAFALARGQERTAVSTVTVGPSLLPAAPTGTPAAIAAFARRCLASTQPKTPLGSS